MFRRVTVSFLAIVLGCLLPWQLATALEISELGKSRKDLSSSLQLLRDQEGQLGADQIPAQLSEFARLQSQTFLTGKGAYWLKLELENRSAEVSKVQLLHPYPYTDTIHLYRLADTVLIPLGVHGDSQAEVQEGQRYRLPGFLLEVPPGQTSFLLRLETRGPAHLEFYLQKSADFLQESREDYLRVGVLFGFVFVMLGYNLFLGFTLRNTAFFVYVGYILGFAVVQGIFSGTLQSLWSWSNTRTFVLNEGLIIAAEAAAVLGSVFAILFLDMRSKMPVLFRALLICFPISLGNMILALFDINAATSFILVTNAFYSIVLLTAGLQGCMAGYRPAYFYLTAWVFLLLGGLITMARIYGLIADSSFATWSQFIGGVIELVLLSIALGDKLNYEQEQAARQIRALNENLSDVNKQLQHHVHNVESIVLEKTSEISTMLSNLQQGVFMVSREGGTIMGQYSHFLEVLLETKDIEGRTVEDVLFAKSNLGMDAVGQNIAALSSCLGEKAISFELNEEAFVRELKWTSPQGDVKTLELEWSPILDQDQNIDKMLVSIRDVTEVRNLLSERAEQKAELAMIGRIIAIPIARFEGFVANCQDFHQSCLRLLDNDPDLSPKTLQKLYLNVHTMKGMARTFQLEDLADSYHRFEDYLEKKKKDGIVSSVNSIVLRERLSLAQKNLQLYLEVNRNVLGRAQTEEAGTDSKNWVRRKVARLRQVDTSQLLPAHRQLMEAVLLDMERHTSLSLEHTLSELILAMPQQASLLGRAAPEINFRECGARLTSLGQTISEKIFIHILNNSLDHGIEAPDRRVALGKPRRGRIEIVSYLEGGLLRIEVSDDGMGLNLPRIERRAFERHIFEEGQDLTPEEIADVIFEPGFSTKDELTPVSGRGVGLDAVRAYLMNVDGSIRVEFTGPIAPNGVAPFKLVLMYTQELWISTGLERGSPDSTEAA